MLLIIHTKNLFTMFYGKLVLLILKLIIIMMYDIKHYNIYNSAINKFHMFLVKINSTYRITNSKLNYLSYLCWMIFGLNRFLNTIIYSFISRNTYITVNYSILYSWHLLYIWVVSYFTPFFKKHIVILTQNVVSTEIILIM